PAVELLRDRAVAARGGRALPQAEVVRLAEVARRLDGLPLALELAAARLRVLSAAELAARLDDPLSTLDSALAGTVESSYRSLDPDSAALLRRLAVFAGPVGLSTVEGFGGTLATLSVLVDGSLVTASV